LTDINLYSTQIKTLLELEKVSISTALPLEATRPASLIMMPAPRKHSAPTTKFQHIGQCMTELLMIHQIFPARCFSGSTNEPLFFRGEWTYTVEHSSTLLISKVLLYFSYVASLRNRDDSKATKGPLGGLADEIPQKSTVGPSTLQGLGPLRGPPNNTT